MQNIPTESIKVDKYANTNIETLSQALETAVSGMRVIGDSLFFPLVSQRLYIDSLTEKCDADFLKEPSKKMACRKPCKQCRETSLRWEWKLWGCCC